MAFSIDGLISGFETSTIIESLLGFQQNQIDTLNSRKQDILTEQSAFKGIEAQILTLQSSLNRLSNTTNSIFDSKTATSSNEDVIEVAAGGGAINSSYQLTVDSLAAAHQVASQGFDSSSATIATGTFAIGIGSGSQTTITVDSSNNNLSAFAAAINEQSDDVNASIVFDQANSNYKLLLTSKETGEDFGINITNSLNSGTGTVPDFSGPAVQEAANAQISLGTGPGAIVAEFSSNEIDGLIENVTLSLKSASPGTVVTVQVESDTSQPKAAIEKFVADFNTLMDYITEQTRFVPDSPDASPLIGNRNVSTIRNRLLATVTGSVSTGTGLARLAQIGVDVNLNGKLEIDSGKLDSALSGGLDGVDPQDIPLLFGLNGTSTNAGVRFVLGSTRTTAPSSPVQVDVTQAAERASITAGTALASSIVIDGSNNQLQVTVNGSASEILTLTAGTYTRSELAAHVEGVINSSDTLSVNDVFVSLDGSDNLVITSEKYGAASQVGSVSGSASTVLGFTGTEAANGQDVQGRFIIDGVEEAAIGNGRLLLGDPDNAITADLQVEVTLGSSDVTAGIESELTITRGITGQLAELANSFLDAENGLFKTADEDYTARLDLIDQSIERVEETTAAKRDDLIREFTALESVLAELQNTGDFITSQLSSIRNLQSNQNRN